MSATHARPPARRRYGQHHLVDRGTLGAILAMAKVRPDDVVLEVGAADGLLTAHLVEQARFVHAFEIDTRFAEGLDRLAAGGTRFEYCYATPLCGPSRCQCPPPARRWRTARSGPPHR